MLSRAWRSACSIGTLSCRVLIQESCSAVGHSAGSEAGLCPLRTSLLKMGCA